MVSNDTRDALARAKETYGAKSLDEALRRLLAEATPDARTLFRRRRRKVERVCERFGIERLIAFGSRVRADRTPASDLDLVATFPEGTSLFDLIDARDALEEAFGVRVDLGTLPPPGDRLRDRIDREGVRLV